MLVRTDCCRDQWDENPLVSAVRSKKIACIETIRKAGGAIAMNPIRLGAPNVI